MSLTYQEISKEIGYTGYIQYPPREWAESLFYNLCANPSVNDFKAALRIFRFAPEAKTPAEVEIIHMLDMGLVAAKHNLYLSRPSWSFKGMVQHYAYKLIPSLSLFYMLRLAISDNTVGLF